ncbi:AraC family transcriptional regulator [Tenacibaculum soleae]|uniref:AraC family transcriptional regulator n=1 Tax=Tenacibaculum soleae TaxID=447689 RepID=UPI00230137D0|nr:AraC family transcriptional regulator [Tenacibaculum soleae]
MKNITQLERYKKLLDYLDKEFKTNIDIKEIEEISFYSYRNINRIFSALQHQTIGSYLKRKKLERSAEYLKYSKHEVSDIALEIGYSDIAAYSKAFKKHFNCSPSSFRNSHYLKDEITEKLITNDYKSSNEKISFEIETLPDFWIFYLPFKGNYTNIKAINKTWKKLFEYALKKELLSDDTIIVGEILDDNEICDTIHCRYNAGIIIENSDFLKTEGLFNTKKIASQTYAKFIHKGNYEHSENTYDLIYSRWLTDVKLEFADKPILEFYVNDEENTAVDDLITEIYIPIL